MYPIIANQVFVILIKMRYYHCRLNFIFMTDNELYCVMKTINGLYEEISINGLLPFVGINC